MNIRITVIITSLIVNTALGNDKTLTQSASSLYSDYDRRNTPALDTIDHSFPDQQFMFLLYTREEALVARFQLLPPEIQKRIYFMAITEHNKERIKAYMRESYEIWQDPENIWQCKQYYAFRKLGTGCLFMMVYTPTPKDFDSWRGDQNWRSFTTSADIPYHLRLSDSFCVIMNFTILNNNFISYDASYYLPIITKHVAIAFLEAHGTKLPFASAPKLLISNDNYYCKAKRS